MTDGCPCPQQYCQVYIDDIVLVACDIDEAVRQVKHLVQILKREKLFISLAKTVLATEWLRFLGYIIGHTIDSYENFSSRQRDHFVVAIDLDRRIQWGRGGQDQTKEKSI